MKKNETENSFVFSNIERKIQEKLKIKEKTVSHTLIAHVW